MDLRLTLHDNHNEAEYISNFSSSYREDKHENLTKNNSAWEETPHHFLIRQWKS